MKRKTKLDRNAVDTLILIAVIIALFILAFFQIRSAIWKRSMRRMEEGVETVMEEITSKLDRDSAILNATADIIAAANPEDADGLDVDTALKTIRLASPLFSTMNLRILLENNMVLTAEGRISNVAKVDSIFFEEEAPLGEHVSNRARSVVMDSYVLRHYVPIQIDGRTVALAYGVTYLNDLAKTLNIANIYNSTADIYIIDTRSGDFIMDTAHPHLGNIDDFSQENDPERETKGGTSWDEYNADIMDQGTGYVVYRTDETDGWEYMYYAPSGVNQWSIAVSVPEKEAFSSVFAARDIFFLIGFLMCLAVAIYYMVIHRKAQRAMAEAVERAVLEEKLKKAEAAERAKTTFLSNMSHDIRTPMNAIIGFTTLAETNIDNKSRVQEYLTKIMSSSNHLLSLINDVLDMSRIESGKLHIEEKPCSISDIFRDMRNIIQTQMQAKQLDFFMDTLDVTDEDIYCDKLHLNQVLLNLLSNAIKFTPAGGSVSMLIRQKPGAPHGYGSYEIRVKDTGIGMSQKFAEHIFEPFERERTSTVSGIQGTGLGMAITKSIVSNMGGDIEVHSEQGTGRGMAITKSIVNTRGGTIEVKSEQGKGTEFIINLQFRLQSETKQVEVIRELFGLRGLVVDDNFSTCDSVTKMLTQIGMRAEWSMHGKEAVLRAKQAAELGDAYYTYIVDWALPDLNGIEVVRQIRAIAGQNVPIIILTAYDWADIEQEARDAGVTAFCNKPIFLSDLRETLMTALGKMDAPLPATIIPDPVEELKGKHILLVEDNELNQEIARELLEPTTAPPPWTSWRMPSPGTTTSSSWTSRCPA